MKKTIILVIVLVTAVSFSGNVFAAWTQAKGHSYNQLTLSHYKTTSKMVTITKDADNNVLSVHDDTFKNEEEEFTSTKLSYYGEYGLMKDLTVILSGGWDWTQSNDIDTYSEESTLSGVGDITLGVRRKVSDNLGGGVLMSVQADVKIPEAYDYENPLLYQNLGDGQYDTSLKMIFGRGFSWGYTVLDAGYKYRFENDQLDPYTFKPSDQFFVTLNGGYNATSWLSIRGSISWNRAVGNARVSNEMIALGKNEFGVDKNYTKDILILDSLGLEQSALSGGISLAFTLAKNIQTVVSYNTDFPYETENASLGDKYSVALVYMH